MTSERELEALANCCGVVLRDPHGRKTWEFDGPGLHELARRLQPARVPEGWQLVPATLSYEMRIACQSVVDLETGDPEDYRFDDGHKTQDAMWAALLSAAPAPPPAEPVREVCGKETGTTCANPNCYVCTQYDAERSRTAGVQRWALDEPADPDIIESGGCAPPVVAAMKPGDGGREGVDVEELARWCDEQSEDPDNVDGAVTLLVIAQTLRRLASAPQPAGPLADWSRRMADKEAGQYVGAGGHGLEDKPGESVPYGVIDPDYARIYTIARCLAWAEGYALAMHGSFTRDLDLIAVPWAERACDPEHLVNRIADAAGILNKSHANPGVKPHGRLAWTLHLPDFGDPRWVDLSIMPRLTGAQQAGTGSRDPIIRPCDPNAERHGFDRTASHAAGRYICECGGNGSRGDGE